MQADYVVSFPGLGIENLEISRVAFSIFGIEVYWYGLLIAIAAAMALFLATRDAKKFGHDEDYIIDSFIVILVTMIIGARLYYVAFSWDEFRGNLMRIVDLRQGGLAFYGGVIAAIVGLWVYHRVKKKSFSKYLDFIAVYLPLGQAIGRIGNFINQEAFGTNTDLPWGMISNGTREYLAARPELGQNPNLPVHPTFAYEAIGNLILFFVLYQVRKRNRVPYGTAVAYFIGYGAIRFFVEGLRTDSLYIGNSSIRVSQLLSLLMVVGGLLYLILMIKKKKEIRSAAEDEVFLSASQENIHPSDINATKDDSVLDQQETSREGSSETDNSSN